MITTHIHSILLVTGLMTTLVIVMFVAPRRGLRLVFGVERPESGALFVARHWGLLVALVGALLVAAAYEPGVRGPAMAVATIEKLVGSVLVFCALTPCTTAATMIAVGDSAMALVYILYFAGL